MSLHSSSSSTEVIESGLEAHCGAQAFAFELGLEAYFGAAFELELEA